MRRSWPVVVLGVLVALAAGAVLGLWLAPGQVPQSARPAAEDGVIDVTSAVYEDVRRVGFRPQLDEESSIGAPRGGTVTSTFCTPGEQLESGQALLTIDARPIIALHTDYPLWRSLSTGDQGEDVAAVQAELRRLGYAAPDTGRWDGATGLVWQEFLKDRGIAKPETQLLLSDLVQLGAQAEPIQACPAAPRSAVGPGQPVVVTGGMPVSLSLAATDPASLMNAPRVALLNDAAAALGEDGSISDPAFMYALAISDQFAIWRSMSTSDPLTLEVRLAEPVELYQVPPQSIYAVNGSQGCVLDDGQPVAVQIISSSLGKTGVSPQRPISRVSLNPQDAPAC
jgi:hypothetical protein